MNIIKMIEKFNKEFTKLSTKYLKKLNKTQYISNFGNFQQIRCDYKDMDLIVTTDYFSNITTRRTIVNTLKETYFLRGSEWTTSAVIGFMEETMSLYLYEGDENIIKEKEKEISNRYNVGVSRLKTQLALFIRNLENGNDKHEILSYFSPYEIVRWKYRDTDKLQNDLEENKIPEWELDLIKEIYEI